MHRNIFPTFCLLGCLLGYALSAQAQASIEGRVVESETEQAIPTARAELQAAVGDAVFLTTSDAQGVFRFPALEPGDYRLRVEARGYLPASYQLRLRPRQPLSLVVELAPQPEITEQVEVRASYTELDPGRTSSGRVLTHQELGKMPSPLTQDIPTLVQNTTAGAVLGHDNFIHLRGNELSLHQFINGVAFLDNPHEHFSAGLSPQIFQSTNLITGGFAAEFGNRFGGILDTTTRSGRSLDGHGKVSLGLGTVLEHDASAEYGGSAGRWGYYFFASGFESDRFLNPPTRREMHDTGGGLRGAVQLDYTGDRNTVKLLLTEGGTGFELPNTEEEELFGRDAARRIRTQTAILTWQHIFSPYSLLSTSVYERNVSDRLLGTTDPVTPFAEGSRSTLTTGIKTDFTWARHGHTVKTGLDLSLFRLRESFRFDVREEEEEEEEPTAVAPLAHLPRGGRPFPFSFTSAGLPEELEQFFVRGRDLGGQISLYVQDRFSPFRNFTMNAGVRWDQINLVDSHFQVSPRVGLAYHVPQTGSVIHFTYNRLFTPPPLEYVNLASFLGTAILEEDERVGNVRPFTQNYYEVGWQQELHPKMFLEVNAYLHTGRNAFENGEISNTRLFLPINFRRSRASGAEVSFVLRQLERIGLTGRFQYAVARVHFFGPVSGGLPGEELEFDERILPAFDQTHTGTANIFYRNPWRNFWGGFTFRYGSGTPVEEEVEINSEEIERVVRLPQHLTADFGTGITVWQQESRRLDFEFNVTNLSNNIYRIGKESETTPIQFAPRRVVSGRLTWRF
ncbi:MAG: TonB-dependent receptor domain-containing protein [Terriglobia bacterium]